VNIFFCQLALRDRRVVEQVSIVHHRAFRYRETTHFALSTPDALLFEHFLAWVKRIMRQYNRVVNKSLI